MFPEEEAPMLLQRRRRCQDEGRSWDHAPRASHVLRSRLLSLVILAFLTVLVLPVTGASARTLSPEPSGGGFVENPDHSWTLYAYGHVVKVYSPAEKETFDRVWHAEEFDLIPFRANSSEVTGISKAEVEAGEAIINRLKTGQPYATGGEREVGEGYMRTVEEKGIITKRAIALFGGLREKMLHSGPLYAGAISISEGMERVLTLPKWTAEHLSGEKEYGTFEGHPIKHHWTWTTEFEVGLELRGCTSISFASEVTEGETCVYVFQPVHLIEERWEPGKKEYIQVETLDKGGSYSSTEPHVPMDCPVDSPYPSCGEKLEGEHLQDESIGEYLDVSRMEGSTGEPGFPAPGLGNHVPKGYETLSGENISEPSYTFSEHREATPVSNPHVAPLADELEIAYALQSSLLPGLEGEVVPSPIAPGEPPLETNQNRSTCGKPVDCATGNETISQTDLQVGGRGVGLGLTRTYNSQAAAAGAKGIFGYGWSNSFGDHLALEPALHLVMLVTASGATVPFSESAGSFTAPASCQDKLSGSAEAGYTLTLPDQTQDKFSGTSGRLETITDRNGNETKLAYSTTTGLLETITDPAGRKLTLKENAEGLVESVKDPMGHEVKYTYENETISTVTLPGETSPRWSYKADDYHQITEITDGRGGKTINKYNANHQVEEQTDPMKRTLAFAYETLQTKITNKATEAVTLEQFAPNGEPASITHGYGTTLVTTETWEYNTGGYKTIFTDGNKHATEFGYNEAGDKTSEKNADGDEWKWEYNSTHDVISETTPMGEKTTIEREAHGNPIKISRPAPKETTQVYEYKWTSKGELESYTDPLKRTWKYEHDTYGDKSAEIDSLGDKRTWGHDEDSFATSTVRPRGHVKTGEEAKYTTKIERDAQERPITITDPLGHTTKIKRDADGNVETVTDGNSHTTTFGHDADNEQTSTKEANGDTSETEWDGAGQVVAQIDGNKHKTKYTRNVLEQVTEETDPLGHKTLKEYDKAGNLEKITDPAKRTTTIKHDAANLPTEISYSDGKTHAVELEYNKDEQRIKMVDGTGTTTYELDQLERPTKITDGHGDSVGYEWDLANENTKLTYPNGKAVERKFDSARRLEKVVDWLGNTTTFGWDADSDPTSTVFPGTVKDEDKTTLNEADQITKIEMKKSTEVLASLTYTRDNDGQVKTITQKGLPGEEKPAVALDENNRLTKYGTTEYKYDAANNPTKEGASENKFNEANELEKAGSTGFSFGESGERAKATPEKGPAITYGWNQAQDLTTVERPEGEGKAKIEDSFASNGDGLRASQTINGMASYLTWDIAEGLPLLLSDGTNSYVYGPGGLPVEAISGAGKPTFVHHDQQGSTRLLTGSTGTVEGKCSYAAYGAPTCEGTTTIPLGYDGQYFNSDTGLIYLRARVYDPATAQFLSRDPLASLTREPYGYAGDNPLNLGDPTGYEALPLPIEGPGGLALCADPATAALCVGAGGYAAIETGKTLVNAIAGEEPGNDEGEAELKKKEAERENCGNPATPPGSKFEWKGKGPVGSNEGSWWDPETRESLYPHLGENSHGPHYDYQGPSGNYRIYPDGRIEPK
jgi:RHS repeat-associated protein